ncbi:MAG TPA: prephenate dehydrogenase dimerization domain-containing protein, partial [Chloroflexota bacterium]|nr:prephenate dehydrogenase dimerization domain-containing protein [Chloroflexota bacterium]
LRELAPHVTGDRALVSIGSLMAPSAEALAGVSAEAICAHPVFGPTVTTTAGLPVIVAPVRGTRWADWLVQTLRSAGMLVHLTTPQAHDARMALVQALLHSLYVALCQAFSGADLPPAQALDWASPTLRLQLGMIARILGQDPELYADLVIGNPAAPAALDALVHALQDLATLARTGDRAGFIAAFTAARESFDGELAELAGAAETALAHLD